MSDEPVKLHYIAQPTPSAPVSLFWASVASTVLAGGVGVACLVGYWLTESNTVAFFGLMWLFFGGLLTLGGFVCGLVYSNQARRVAGRTVEMVRRARIGVALPLVNILLALGCAWLGNWLVESPRATFSIYNKGTTKIDSGRILFGSHIIPFGAIDAQGADQQVTRITNYGKVIVEFKRGGVDSSVELLDWSDEDEFLERPLRIDIVIDDVGARLRD